MKKPNLFNVLTMVALGACVVWFLLVVAPKLWWLP